jgi:hypothetical protein
MSESGSALGANGFAGDDDFNLPVLLLPTEESMLATGSAESIPAEVTESGLGPAAADPRPYC